LIPAARQAAYISALSPSLAFAPNCIVPKLKLEASFPEIVRIDISIHPLPNTSAGG
jgi:hypothetical protein